MTNSIPKPEDIAVLVQVIRSEKVLLDGDLTVLYDVPTKALNQAIKQLIAEDVRTIISVDDEGSPEVDLPFAYRGATLHT